MKIRYVPVAVVPLTAAAVVILGHSLLLGLSIGFALGLLVGFALTQAESKKAAPPQSTLPPYNPESVQKELEGAFVRVKRALRPAEDALGTTIYQAFRETLHYLPTAPVKGAAEIWDTVQRELITPTLADLQTGDREAMANRIEARCAALPLTLRSLATTLLPEGTATLQTTDGVTFYLDNLHAMPPIGGMAPGSAIEKLQAGLYFRIGDEVFLGKERFVYRCGSDVWHEVLGESLRDASVKALEWEIDDHQLENLLQSEAALGLEDVGLDLAQLKKMDEEEEGSLRFRGETFRYDESDQATCQALTQGALGEGAPIEKFQYFDFIASVSKSVIGIERWGSETKVYGMKSIATRDLEIFLP